MRVHISHRTMWWYLWYLDHARRARKVGDRQEAAWALTQAGDARRWIVNNLMGGAHVESH